MSFFSIALRGLLRRPLRTFLTLIGISIGIGAVVALVGMARGLESSWASGMKSRGTDIVVNNMGGALTPKPFPAEVRDRIAQNPGIAKTCTILVELLSVENADMMVLSGREWGGFSWDNLKLTSGRLPANDQEKAVVLGTTAAEVLKKKVGDPIQIETEELKVVGIADGGAVVENGSIILSLSTLQAVLGMEGKINIIDVRAVPGTTPEGIQKICAEISAAIPEARAQAAGEHIRSSQGYKLINAMSWGTSLLAVLVGLLGVMNTMLMTVFERRQEMAILLALGWKRSRIVRMILWESALLGTFGGLVGVVIGWAGTHLLRYAPAIRGMLEPDLTPQLIGYALVGAIFTGILSGLYPAWRSSRISPAAALHG